MKLALINPGDAPGGWIERLVLASESQVSVVYGKPWPSNVTVCEEHPADQWEALLHETEMDAVLVGTGSGSGSGTGSQELGEQLTRIVQSGLPMLVPHPAATMLDCFALQMIQRETQSLIYPLVPECDNDAIAVIRHWWTTPAESPVGTIEQLAIERPAVKRDREAVERLFAIDAFLLRQMIGNIQKLSAVGIDPPEDDWARLRIQMVSGDGPPIGWSMAGSVALAPGTLTVVGSTGSARIALERFPRHWQILKGESGELAAFARPQPPNPIDLAATAIATNDPRWRIWEDACRSLELADTIELSARRGKTIELHESDVTEAGTFRGMMAAGGCLLLLGTLAMTLSVATVESIWPFGGAMRSAPWILLAIVLVGFLSLQLLNLALPKDPTPSSKDRDS